MQFGSSTFNVTSPYGFQCKPISFDSSFTGSSSDVRVQISLHEVGPTFEASVSWVESVSLTGFTACVETAGPMNGGRVINVQYVAFVGVPSGGMAGVQAIPLYTAGTKCVEVLTTGKVPEVTAVNHYFLK